MFKRISHRAGLATFEMLKNINTLHTKICKDIFKGILEISNSEDKAVSHLSNCQGIKFKSFVSKPDENISVTKTITAQLSSRKKSLERNTKEPPKINNYEC